ncbi:MAG: hypothetical protein MUP09_07075 [Thiovulaceae bacterium]|nr:hypothetical protein [Sulfurimonadaceae bacterium]
MHVLKQFFWLMVWGAAFAYIEASVVVYLRKIYYPEGFAFPAVIAQNSIIFVEILRELATLILLWATATLAYTRVQSRLGAFMVLFGIWDIFYYLFLKLLLNWPEGLASWDILFLVPLPWVGPVWAPVVVSFGLVYSGSAILLRNEKGSFLNFDGKFVWIEIISAAVIILSFLIPGEAVTDQSVPTHFPYYLFWAGFIAGFGTFLYKFHRSR